MPTPMMQQFFAAKEEHPDAIMFFRMGDFYETFFDDAELVARELELTLTARDKDSKNPVPMAGVPHHAAQGYIRRLLEAGMSVAICEQLEDPSASKGIVRRGVVQVLTPGMHIDEGALDAKTNNFVTSVAVSNLRTADVFGVASLDVSTGELRVCEVLDADALRSELLRLRPTELLVADSHRTLIDSALVDSSQSGQGPRVVVRADEVLSLKRAIGKAAGGALERFTNGPQQYFLSRSEIEERIQSLDQFTIRDRKAVEGSLALLLDYVGATRGGLSSHVEPPVVYRADNFVALDPASAANLEIFETLMGGRKKGSLFSVIDKTVTSAGGRRLRTWLSYPLKDPAAIIERQEAVTALVSSLQSREALREQLGKTTDIQRVSGKLAAGQGNARDVVALADTLSRIPAMVDALSIIKNDRLQELLTKLDPCEDLVAMVNHTIVDEPPIALNEGGLIRQGFNDELDELIELTTSGKKWLLRYEAEQRKVADISSLKVRHNRVFGYYIEVTKANIDRVPERYIRKQTLANAERYFTPELKEYEEKIISASEKRHALEYEIFEQTRAELIAELGRIREAASQLAELDALAGLAELAHKQGYVAPIIREEKGISITEGRHPVVETMLGDERFVPNNTSLTVDERLLIITGPNMAGKSTVIRQVALITLLAQIGSHVPAKAAEIGVVDQIFSRVGASDNLARGQSTFMVEMSEVAHILNHATDRSLIILDEIGRGTATYDGLSIAWAVAEHLHDEIGAFALFATHYHELTELAHLKTGVRNYNIAVKEWNNEIVFLRKLIDGPANRSYGIQVARLAGVPDPVVVRATEILSNLEEAAYDENMEPRKAREYTGGIPIQKLTNQLSLFGGAPKRPATKEPQHPVLRELQEAPLDTMPPLEALNTLARWQKRLARERKADDS